MSVRFKTGDKVFADGASAIVGVVLVVDEEEETVTVQWLPTQTTEDAGDLWLEGEQAEYERSKRR
jgi:hypothetical protein